MIFGTASERPGPDWDTSPGAHAHQPDRSARHAADVGVQMTQGETSGSREVLAIALRNVRLPCGR